MQVEVRGKAAHAGVEPESGRNVVMEIAHQILQVRKLGNREKQTTVNFTVVKAGDRANVIPDSALAQDDVRAAVLEEFDRVETDLTKVAAKKLISDTQVTILLDRKFPPMQKTKQTAVLAAKAQAIYGELGRVLTLEGSGGAADSIFAAGIGMPTLDGLGLVGGKAHTADEYVEVERIVPRLYLLTRLLMVLGSGK